MWSRIFGAAILTLTAVAAVHAADITGRVVIKRKLSNRTVTASACFYQRGATVQLGSETEKDPLAYERGHVIVYLEGPVSSTSGTAVMQQKDRRFVPDLLVIPAGSTVSLPNEDAIFHNVFSLSKPKSFDLGNYTKGQTRSLQFPNPGIVFVNCHLHPNMGAVIFVSPNRWSTRADESGQFQLSDVPPGDYTVVAWHKAVGFFRQKAHVGDTSVTGIEFLIPFDEIAAEKKNLR